MYTLQVRILLPEWKHVCVTVDPLAGGRVSLAIDGQPVASRLIKELASSSTNNNRRIDLSQMGVRIRFGSVGLLNVYGGAEAGGVGGRAAVEASTVPCGSLGTALAWNPAEWIYPRGWPAPAAVYNFTRPVDVSEICGDSSNSSSNITSPGVLLVVPLHLKVSAAYGVCSRLGEGGQIPAYNSLADWRTAWDSAVVAVNTTTTVDFLWQPFHRSGSSDTFVSRYNASLKLDPAMWNPGQPNNLDEKCVLCDRQGCWDKYCEDEQPFVCQFPAQAPPLLRLRGLCRLTNLDTVFYPTNRLGDLVWIGLSATYIRFDHVMQRWEARVSGSDTWAYSQASYESLLLGTQTWTIFHDRKCMTGTTGKYFSRFKFRVLYRTKISTVHK